MSLTLDVPRFTVTPLSRVLSAAISRAYTIASCAVSGLLVPRHAPEPA